MQKNEYEHLTHEQLIEIVKNHFLNNWEQPANTANDINLIIANRTYTLTAGDFNFIILRIKVAQGELPGAHPDYKFHINVAEDRIADAWAITAVACAENEYSGMKVYSNKPEGDSEQIKKPITIYTRPERLDEDEEGKKHLSLLKTIERRFRKAGIKPLSEPKLTYFDAKLMDEVGKRLRFITYRKGDPQRRSHYVPYLGERFNNYYRVSSHIIIDTNQGRVPLHYAAENGNTDVVKKILEKSQTQYLILADDKGLIPLQLAILNKHIAVVELLLENDPLPQVNYADLDGDTALHQMIKIGPSKESRTILQLLLAIKGINLNHLNNRNKTALLCAKKKHYKSAADALLNANAILEVPSRSSPTSMNHYAARDGDLNRLNLTLSSINNQDGKGWTPLHYAAQGSHNVIINALITNNADSSIKNIHGRLPLHLAGKKCQRDALLLLLGKSPEKVINVRDINGRTPLHHAVLSGNKKAVTLFLSITDIQFVRDEHGMTPIHIAAQGHLSILKLLLVSSLYPLTDLLNSRDSSGKTPLHYAAASNDTRTVKYLIFMGADPEAVDSLQRVPYEEAPATNPELRTLLGEVKRQKSPKKEYSFEDVVEQATIKKTYPIIPVLNFGLFSNPSSPSPTTNKAEEEQSEAVKKKTP